MLFANLQKMIAEKLVFGYFIQVMGKILVIWKPKTGNRKPENGERKPEEGDRRQKTGNRKQETVVLKHQTIRR